MLSFKEFYNLSEEELENLQEWAGGARHVWRTFQRFFKPRTPPMPGPRKPHRPTRPTSRPVDPDDGIDVNDDGGGTGLLEPKPGQETEFDTGSGWDDSMAKPNDNFEIPPGHHDNVADAIFGELPEIFSSLWKAYPELFDRFSALLRMLIRAGGNVDAADGREMIDILRAMGINITVSNNPGSATGISVYHSNGVIQDQISDQLGQFLGIADGLLDEIIDLLNSGY